ncbi:hypothetical protein [Halobacillus litoralis]|uniref:hypothetical protein n=1 Tax=Halobacillus litoralis TaxID=45668 RepID=UPI001CD3B8B4|nr:hypothetical protein [Halobacillus litoralis]MCA1024285.1 hypothetical protein [Halobacillus litoralis]
MLEMKPEYTIGYNRNKCKYVKDENGEGIAKECRKCGEIKPLDEYYKHNVGFLGVQTRCTECNKEDWRTKYRERKLIKQREYVEKNKEYLREKDKEYREKNKEREKARTKKWHHENKEHVSRVSKEYYERTKEARKPYTKMKDKRWYEANKEYKNAYHRQFRQDNPEMVRRWARTRRTLKRKLPNTLTEEDEAHLIEIQKQKCIVSGKTNDLDLEHFIPLSWNTGGTTFENCYFMDTSLNRRKLNRNPFEWVEDQPKNYQQRFHDHLVPMLADRNGMTVGEFTAYVNDLHKQYIANTI